MVETDHTAQNVFEKESWKDGAGGDKFYTREFGPNGQPRAVVLFLHGLMEHSGRYVDTFRVWAARGIHVFVFDQRGYGKTCSDPEMKAKGAAFARTNGIAQVWDTEFFIKELAQRFPGVPLFLMGFSMGGGRVLWFVTRKSEPPSQSSVKLITGVIAHAPHVWQSVPRASKIIRWVARTIRPLAPNLVIPTGTKPETLTRNSTVVKEWLDDPLIMPQGTVQILTDLLDDGEELEREGYKNWPKDLPLLILHGDSDQVTCPVGSKLFFDKVDATDKTYKSFPGGYHELHNEPDEIKEGWHEACLSWIDRIITRST